MFKLSRFMISIYPVTPRLSSYGVLNCKFHSLSPKFLSSMTADAVSVHAVPVSQMKTNHSLCGLSLVCFTKTRIPIPCPYRAFCTTGDNTCQKEWQFNAVDPFGKVILRSTQESVAAHYIIRPVDVQENPSQDEASVKFTSDGDPDSPLHCSYNRKDIILQMNKQGVTDVYGKLMDPEKLPCIQISVPIKFNVDAQLGGISSLTIDTFENNDISIEMEQGHCRLRNIKTENIQIKSDGGSVTSEELLQGNTFIQTQSGDVSIQKPVGQTLTIQTDEGNISIRSLYADTSSLHTHCGDVQIGSLHRNATVNVAGQGSLNIGSVDGTLHATVKEGDIDLHVAQHEWINVTTTKGDIAIRVPLGLSSTLDLVGSAVRCHSDLTLEDTTYTAGGGLETVTGRLAGDDVVNPNTIGHIVARTNDGKVLLECGDWLSSLGLKLPSEE